ncbi:MAG: metallophosphoesterase [Kosmotoga sp.]|uniref:metallophosphoesterase family protein n=1 Tax=Kosmotoga sp. TaxID=1955248 RepID=UPI001DCAFFBB|nr:metallophosphoesterase [Kosmotoga sp.]MBO8166304.1 metallophosphoesterase [Kosmotoga sp.]
MAKILILIVFLLPALTFGAFLTDARDGKVTINWYTNESADSSCVLIDGFGTERTFYSAQATSFHRIVLEDLDPLMHYNYEVESYSNKKRVYNAKGNFSLTITPSFSFALYGDSRSNFEIHRKVCKEINQYHPSFIINLGDIVYMDSIIRDWVDYFESIDVFENSFYYSALGNHERAAINFRRFLDFPGDKLYYSFQYGGILFIVLNTNQRYDWCSKQYKWLKALLENRGPDIEFTVVITHHPPYNNSIVNMWRILMNLSLVPLFEQYKVDLVISGHIHNYQRFLKNSITYLISGGGGALLDTSKATAGFKKDFSNYHFILFEYVKGKLTAKCIDIDGNIRDEFVITSKEN